jgi:hypothetical protein
VSFNSSMAAKKFLVSRIVAEANRQGIPLSEVEQKMLYFSESYPTLPEMAEVSEKFDKECNSEEYEEKISKLSQSAYRRDLKESDDTAQRWKDAIGLLKTEDHYILVMVSVSRPASDVVKLFLTGIVVTVFGLALIVALEWAKEDILPRIPRWILSLAFAVSCAVFLFLGLNDKAGKKVGDWAGGVIERITRW